MSIGIGKRELMEDYYIDEIPDVVEMWNAIHDPDAAETSEVDAMTFLGQGGEWVSPEPGEGGRLNDH